MRLVKSNVGRTLERDWLFWKLIRRLNRRIIVLGYHGVIRDDEVHDEWVQRLHLPLKIFEAQMEFIASHFETLEVSQVHSWQGRRPAVHVTFDDGYTNFVTTALPVLQRFGIPASVYVIPGFIGTKRRLPTFVGRAAFGNCAPGRIELDTLGMAFEISNRSSRQQAYAQISNVLKMGRADDVTNLVLELKSLLPADQWSEISTTFDSDSMMTWCDIDEAHRAGMVVGAHTSDHFGLGPEQDPEVVSSQIRDSVTAVRDRLGDCQWFAYPNGTIESTSPAASKELESLGLAGAWTLVPGSVNSRADRYLLPRIPVPRNIARFRMDLNSPL